MNAEQDKRDTIYLCGHYAAIRSMFATFLKEMDQGGVKRDPAHTAEFVLADLTNVLLGLAKDIGIDYLAPDTYLPDFVSEIGRVIRARFPICHVCQKPAACLGSYEASETAQYSCDSCCAHGNEDGICLPVPE